jgi:hypothetical protein
MAMKKLLAALPVALLVLIDVATFALPMVNQPHDDLSAQPVMREALGGDCQEDAPPLDLSPAGHSR